MTRASESEHAYFARIAQQNKRLSRAKPPASLDDALTQLDAMRQRLGELARAGLATVDDPGDLAGHVAFLAHIRAVMQRRGKVRP